MKRDWIKSPELAKRGFATFYVQSFSFGGKPFDSFGIIRKITTSHNDIPAVSYRRKVAALDAFAGRFRFVNIERLDWRQCVDKYDSGQAFFYIDPPYLNSTNSYSRSLAPVDHVELVERLLALQGGAALSCYDNDVYKPLVEEGWARYNFAASSSVRLSIDNLGDSRRRVETLYIKPY
jgi:DNA adenine methylase